MTRMVADAVVWVDDDFGDRDSDQTDRRTDHVAVAVSAVIAVPVLGIVVNHRRTRNETQETETSSCSIREHPRDPRYRRPPRVTEPRPEIRDR